MSEDLTLDEQFGNRPYATIQRFTAGSGHTYPASP